MHHVDLESQGSRILFLFVAARFEGGVFVGEGRFYREGFPLFLGF